MVSSGSDAGRDSDQESRRDCKSGVDVVDRRGHDRLARGMVRGNDEFPNDECGGWNLEFGIRNLEVGGTRTIIFTETQSQNGLCDFRRL